MTRTLTVIGAMAAGLLLGLCVTMVGCTQRVVIVWPSEPLKVEVVNCPALGGTTTAILAPVPDAGGAPEKPPAEPRKVKLGDKPIFLAGAGTTVIYVDYDGGNYGGGVSVFEADAGSDPSGNDAACAAGGSRREVWKLSNGGHWDAQHTVERGKILCAAAASYVEGDVSWQTR